ncbi:MAG: lipoyl(octanoyl) transferase LipB [Candidatus Omnitrophica bacterium]|nr:lipoyl(octanoyl) transferase LipB [Candidatus Omnitrophota bacterium]
MTPLKVIDLGTASYNETYFLQKEILSGKKRGDACEYLILVEHPNVLTIGRSGSKDNILVEDSALKNESVDVVYTDRGGDITFHGTGQIVVYPIFDLRHHAKDVRLFIRQLEKVISLTIKAYGIETDEDKEHTGVWVKGEKIGFIGIGLSNWITYHGISLNANVNLRYFSMIRPCGIEGITVTSMENILHRRIDIEPLKKLLVETFCEVFSLERCTYNENASVAFAAASACRVK